MKIQKTVKWLCSYNRGCFNYLHCDYHPYIVNGMNQIDISERLQAQRINRKTPRGFNLHNTHGTVHCMHVAYQNVSFPPNENNLTLESDIVSE